MHSEIIWDRIPVLSSACQDCHKLLSLRTERSRSVEKWMGTDVRLCGRALSFLPCRVSFSASQDKRRKALLQRNISTVYFPDVNPGFISSVFYVLSPHPRPHTVLSTVHCTSSIVHHHPCTIHHPPPTAYRPPATTHAHSHYLGVDGSEVRIKFNRHICADGTIGSIFDSACESIVSPVQLQLTGHFVFRVKLTAERLVRNTQFCS